MVDEQLVEFLGRPPTDADRAIYADQSERLVHVFANALLPMTDGLQVLSPFSVVKP
ncbi:hypothetical protein [Loktanella sp. S4079]|uniref:hypothetical protein n=1 Tax=Loktanella sp. S4079 TaxID=579483 RepID=UPI000AE107E0|nr:hypothetical protein [Loktanella sp. S4079]